MSRPLRGSIVPTLSTYGGSTPIAAMPRVEHGVRLGRRYDDRHRRDVDALGLEPRPISSPRVNSEIAMTAAASRCAIASPRRWNSTPRRVNTSGWRRNARSCTVTTSGVPRAGGTARLGACMTSAGDRHRWPPEPVPELVAPGRVRPTEVDVVGERWLAIRAAARPPRTSRARCRPRAGRRAGRRRSGRCRRAPAGTAGRRAARPSCDRTIERRERARRWCSSRSAPRRSRPRATSAARAAASSSR